MADFSLSPVVISAFVCVASQPFALAILARIPGLRGRNPVQFLLATLVSISVWLVFAFVLPQGRATYSPADIAVALMLIGGGMLFLLEVWALLSRGYTLQILLTLYRSGGPMQPQEIADQYRSGEGVEWVFRHRVSGLIAARMVQETAEGIKLRFLPGVPIALAYLVIIRLLGLRRTG